MVGRPYLKTSIFMDVLDPGKRFFELQVSPQLLDVNGSPLSLKPQVAEINANLRRIANALEANAQSSDPTQPPDHRVLSRIYSSARLYQHRDTILYGWMDGHVRQDWLLNASKDEIVSWARQQEKESV